MNAQKDWTNLPESQIGCKPSAKKRAGAVNFPLPAIQSRPPGAPALTHPVASSCDGVAEMGENVRGGGE